MVDNSEREKAVLNYLQAYATDNNILCKFFYAGPRDPSLVFKVSRRIGINMNWYNQDEIPFSLGHEIGHMMIDEPDVRSEFTGYKVEVGEEKAANIFSLHLLYDYSCRRGDDFQEPGPFMQAYEIPFDLEEETCKMFSEYLNYTAVC